MIDHRVIYSTIMSHNTLPVDVVVVAAGVQATTVISATPMVSGITLANWRQRMKG